MWGIFDKKTDTLDCDPEPMVFFTCSEAVRTLYETEIYPVDEYYVRKLTEKEDEAINPRGIVTPIGVVE